MPRHDASHAKNTATIRPSRYIAFAPNIACRAKAEEPLERIPEPRVAVQRHNSERTLSRRDAFPSGNPKEAMVKLTPVSLCARAADALPRFFAPWDARSFRSPAPAAPQPTDTDESSIG